MEQETPIKSKSSEWEGVLNRRENRLFFLVERIKEKSKKMLAGTRMISRRARKKSKSNNNNIIVFVMLIGEDRIYLDREKRPLITE